MKQSSQENSKPATSSVQKSYDLFCMCNVVKFTILVAYCDWASCAAKSSLEALNAVVNSGPQYLYIQMEHCEKKTLRNLIMDGLSRDHVSQDKKRSITNQLFVMVLG